MFPETVDPQKHCCKNVLKSWHFLKCSPVCSLSKILLQWHSLLQRHLNILMFYWILCGCLPSKILSQKTSDNLEFPPAMVHYVPFKHSILKNSFLKASEEFETRFVLQVRWLLSRKHSFLHSPLDEKIVWRYRQSKIIKWGASGRFATCRSAF